MSEISEKGVSDSLKTFFLLSFKYSQGNVDYLHKSIFSYGKYKGILDNIPKNIPQELLSNLKTPNVHISLSRIDADDEFVRSWARMYEASQKNPKIKRTVETITNQLFLEDNYYLTKSPRPMRGLAWHHGIDPDSNLDPYASMIRKYVVKRSPTGHWVFDSMFADVGKEIVTGSYEQQLSNVINAWKKRHPGLEF